MLQQRRLGRTGLSVSELALGTWGLASGAYGKVELPTFVRTVSDALANGITTFDMAPLWGAGEAEKIVGMAVAPQRDRVCLISRAGRQIHGHAVVTDFSSTALRRDLEASLRRLGTDHLDVWLLHQPTEDVFEREDLPELIQALKQEGKIRAWGASVSSVAQAQAGLDASVEVLCVVHNLLQTDTLEGVRTELERLQIGVLARSPLHYGLLSGNWTEAHQFALGDHRADRWDINTLPQRVRGVNALLPMVQPPIPSLTGLALRFVLSEPLISAALLGARKPAHVIEAVVSIQEPPYLSEPQLQQLHELLSQARASQVDVQAAVSREDTV